MKKFISFWLILLFISNLPICEATVFTVNTNDSLQNTINNATSNDIIYVSGVHSEIINVNSQDIIIKSVNEASVGGFQIFEPNVTIDGFKITSSGIYIIDHMSYCDVINNDVSNSQYGISLGLNTVANSVINNTIYDCSSGIDVDEGHTNIIRLNTITNCDAGIDLMYTDTHTISENIITRNLVGIYLDEGNGGNVIYNNNVKYNSYGIKLGTGNGNNVIYNNNFNNTNNVVIDDTTYTNQWNTTRSSGKNIIGRSCIQGNYWSTPTNTGFSDLAIDNDTDCIADSAYVIVNNNIDYGALVLSSNVLVDNVPEPVPIPIPVPIPDSSSSSSGSSGSSKSSGSSASVGGSPEPANNVAIKEMAKTYVSSANVNTVNLKTNATNVTQLKFNSTKTFGTQTVIVEELKNSSYLTRGVPLINVTVIKYINIWVGSTSRINENTLENSTIYFRMSSDVTDKYDIYVLRYDGKKWSDILVTEMKKDSEFTYYKVDTPAYGQFAVCGYDRSVLTIEPVNRSHENVTINSDEHSVGFWASLINWMREMFR